MIAMQYTIALPADYDMSIIERRILEKGRQTDHFPGLRFKAYLVADKKGNPPQRENRYAPFYLWANEDGMNQFLLGSGFKGLKEAFGRPEVQTWVVLDAHVLKTLRQARFATHDDFAIPHHADLGDLWQSEREKGSDAIAQGALASVIAYNPQRWSAVRIAFWESVSAAKALDGYAVHHLSEGERFTE
ncbi:MAG: DUF4865 family protein [Burkholderiaceae bacterium]